MRQEMNAVSAIVPGKSKWFSPFPEHLAAYENMKLKRLQNAMHDHENLQRRTEKAKQIKELALLPKEVKIMGRQAQTIQESKKKGPTQEREKPEEADIKEHNEGDDPIATVTGLKTK